VLLRLAAVLLRLLLRAKLRVDLRAVGRGAVLSAGGRRAVGRSGAGTGLPARLIRCRRSLAAVSSRRAGIRIAIVLVLGFMSA
jgi:hypothetical protein